MNNQPDGEYRQPVAQLSSVCYQPDAGWPLDEVSLDIHAGELHVLLGGTDSGRALILQMLMGLIRPDSGSLLVFGGDPRSDVVRHDVGATLSGTHFPGEMRVREIIDLVRAHYREAVTTDELLEAFRISHLAGRRAETLDQGEERWISVALAFAGKPDLVVLDQPTAAMDFDWRLMLWQHLRDFTSQGGAVIMTSHFIEETEAFADRVTVVARGQIVSGGTPDEVKRRSNRRRIQVSTRSQLDLDGCEVQQGDGMATIYTDDSDAAVRHMIDAGVDFSDLRIDEGSLEEAVIKLTGAEGG